MKTIIHVIILIALFAFTASYCSYYFGGYEGSGDGNDYAALARNIVSGKGFSLGHIYPLGLTFNAQIPQPNNIWAPGYPLYLSLWFSAIGIEDKAALCASIVALWLMILSGYLLGRRIGGDIIAILSAMLIGLSQIVLYAAIEGTPEILTGALIAFSVYFLLSPQKSVNLILSGCLMGLAFLARYQIAIIGIPIAILFMSNYRRNLFIWMAAILVTVSPWLIRNWIVFGNPFFTLQSYGEFAKGMRRFGDPYFIYRSFTPMSLWYTIVHFPFDMVRKFVSGLLFFATSFPLRFNYLGIIPFVFGLLKINSYHGVQRKCILFAFIAAILVIILSSLDGHHDRHLIPLQPFFVVSTLLGGIAFSRATGFYRYKFAVAFAALFLFVPARYPYQEYGLKMIAEKSQADSKAYEEISRIVTPDEVIVSDASDAVWWYANRMSIWIPVQYADFKSLMARDDCHYVYFTDPITFMNKLPDQDLADFGVSYESVASFNGPGRLYILYKGSRLNKM